MTSQPQIRILFVDDEAKVLDGLRRSLRAKRGTWRMFFAHSGQQAMDILARHPCELVMADMRMPGMDGAQLLEKIRSNHPDAVRMVLSGHSEKDSLLKTITVAHQHLAKPCQRDSLTQVVDHVIWVRTLLEDPALRKVVSGIEFLPALGATMEKATKLMEADTPDFSQAAKFIGNDIGLMTKVLHMANCASWGNAPKTTNMRTAFALMGPEALKGLLNKAANHSKNAMPLEKEYILSLRKHGLLVGNISREIVRTQTNDQKVLDNAFTTGFLHEIGKLALRLNQQESLVDRDSETYRAIGAYLTGLWGLPKELVEAIAMAHQPELNCDGKFSLVTALHVAENFVHNANQYKNGKPFALKTKYLNRLGLSDQVDSWREISRKVFEKGELVWT